VHDAGGRGVFEQESAGPARSAPNTYSSRWKVVSTMTFGGSGSAQIRSVAAIPSTPGMRTSISTTSGRSALTNAATDDDLDELIGFVAAEANHEPNQRRRQRLDAAFDALTAAQARDGR
jgi:hypothetical protein